MLTEATSLTKATLQHDSALSKLDGVSRRDALKQLAGLCGLGLSLSSLDLLADSFLLPTDTSRNKLGLLNKEQLALVQKLCDLIIPTTDTPGAAAVDSHTFISGQLFYCVDEYEQKKFVGNLARIEKNAKKKLHKAFLKASTEQQITLLSQMEKKQQGFDDTDRDAIKQMKSYVVFAYYTSEVGATQELAYLAIPGGYKGDVKFKSVGKAWAL